MSPETRVGTSGWSYPGWRNGFYPAGLRRGRELEYIATRFNAVEVNGSFYSLQRPGTYRRWYEATPDDFVFAVKGSRFITHNKKLGDVAVPLANFFASGVLRLGEKLGPILWQLSSALRYQEDRVARFLELLPRDGDAAAKLARRHDARLRGRSWTRSDGVGRIRHALEPRHPSYFVPAFAELCREHGVAIAVSDSSDWPTAHEVTADFVYVRLHGATQAYASRYTDEELDAWARRIRAWRRGRRAPGDRPILEAPPGGRGERDVYVFFDNDAHGHAPHDALRLAARLGGGASRGVTRRSARSGSGGGGSRRPGAPASPRDTPSPRGSG